MTFDRRTFIAAAGAAASAPLLSACATPGATSTAAVSSAPHPFMVGKPSQPLLPRSKAPRIVIAGGGWGGLTTAANLRQLAPQAEVVLLDRNPVFFSSPLSNLWLVNMVDGEQLTHDYLRVADKLGYKFFQAEVQQVDRDRRTVTTSLGTLDYDWLVLAPGIRYHYEAWFGNDRQAADATRTRYPLSLIHISEPTRPY